MQLTSRFDDALVYAARLHAKQQRKGSGEPYVAHLLAVCSLTLEFGGDEDQAIAALLHDAVEDQGGAATRAEILRRFGPAVTEIVDGCTDTDQPVKPPWQARKEAYIAHVQTASPAVKLVSACDKLHNARSIVADQRRIGDAVWQKFKGGKSGTLWYYRSLADIFRRDVPAGLAAELDRVIGDMQRLAEENA